MKIKVFFLMMVGVMFNYTGSAQATATFTASVTIIEPIGITTTANMNFAHLDAKSGGSVVLTPENSRIASGGILLSDESTVSAATFVITGEQGFAYSISLPEAEHQLSNGSESMIIKDFTSSLASNGTISNGTSVVRVGATLKVNPQQKPGVYTSPSPMNVTVNYN